MSQDLTDEQIRIKAAEMMGWEKRNWSKADWESAGLDYQESVWIEAQFVGDPEADHPAWCAGIDSPEFPSPLTDLNDAFALMEATGVCLFIERYPNGYQLMRPDDDFDFYGKQGCSSDVASEVPIDELPSAITLAVIAASEEKR